jgi:8-oxo-dGTP pyrophosphatase MutT (NUDIX family)
LVDEGETPEQAAIRELKEETGYVGVVSDVTPVMFNGSFASWFALLYFWVLYLVHIYLGWSFG